jgi:predicted amidohydrolase
MDNLSVSLVQYDIAWENPEANMKNVERLLAQVPSETDLVLLPEMFLTGFSMNASSLAQTMNGDGVNWLKHIARTKNYAIGGSLIISENGSYFNRFLMATPDGNLRTYDKRHLFRMGNEEKVFSQGKSNTIISLAGWNLMPQVCYDLRFPVWCRNTGLKYDVLTYSVNWPAARREAYITLLKARAIENQCYVLAVNRIGTDGLGLAYAGDTLIIDYKGQIVKDIAGEGVLSCTLSLNDLKTFRTKFPVHYDADDFQLKL